MHFARRRLAAASAAAAGRGGGARPAAAAPMAAFQRPLQPAGANGTPRRWARVAAGASVAAGAATLLAHTPAKADGSTDPTGEGAHLRSLQLCSIERPSGWESRPTAFTRRRCCTHTDGARAAVTAGFKLVAGTIAGTGSANPLPPCSHHPCSPSCSAMLAGDPFALADNTPRALPQVRGDRWLRRLPLAAIPGPAAAAGPAEGTGVRPARCRKAGPAPRPADGRARSAGQAPADRRGRRDGGEAAAAEGGGGGGGGSAVGPDQPA